MASVHPQARIGTRNSIGTGVTIGSSVKIGDGNRIGDYVSILGNVTIGNDNIIGVGSVLGGISNHVMRNKLNGNSEVSDSQAIQIGNENLLGEFTTVHTSVASVTSIGNQTNIGTRAHIAHDVIIEDRVIISIHCGLGGFVKILQGANLGIAANIHPRIVVGQYSMIGVGSVVIRHILPAATVAGNPQRYLKPNVIGMERNGLSKTSIKELTRYLNSELGDVTELSSETRAILAHFHDIVN